MKRDPAVHQADQDARIAHARFVTTLHTAQARLRPSALRKEASDKMMDAALDAFDNTRRYARANPAQVAALAAAIGAILARGPLMALLRRLFVMGRDAYRTHRSNKD
ncbi:MAG: hypothetical protein ABI395_10310 [Sphingobium sp.]